MITDYNLPDNSFIGGWLIGEEITDRLIQYYEENKEAAVPGRTYNPEIKGVDVMKEAKDSMDLSIFAYSNHKPITDYQKLLNECCKKYCEKYEDVHTELTEWRIREDYNIQKYPKGGGFKIWHCERNGTELTSSRCLVFMTYLNNIENGGTEFKYQNLKIPAVKGLTLIWPSDWTHTHRGIISQTSEKYIITGWFNN